MITRRHGMNERGVEADRTPYRITDAHYALGDLPADQRELGFGIEGFAYVAELIAVPLFDSAKCSDRTAAHGLDRVPQHLAEEGMASIQSGRDHPVDEAEAVVRPTPFTGRGPVRVAERKNRSGWPATEQGSQVAITTALLGAVEPAAATTTAFASLVLNKWWRQFGGCRKRGT
ncbi:hypothetical protein ACWENQ_33415 [Nonomuraea sp. NPDC004354]